MVYLYTIIRFKQVKYVKAFSKTFIFITAALLLSADLSQAQTLLKNHIKIEVHIEGLKDGYYYLNSFDKVGIDSCYSKSGLLTYNYFGEPAPLYIASTKDNGNDGTGFFTPVFWSDKSDIAIIGKAGDIGLMEVSGSAINVKVQRLQKLTIPLKQERLRLLEGFKLAEADSIRKKITEIYLTEITHNLNSIYGMMILNQLALSKSVNLTEVEYLLNMFDAKLKDSQYALAVKGILNNSLALGIGKMAPDFVQRDIDNKNVALSEYKGKFVLLEFWGSWCGPCRDENPYLVKIYKKFGGSSFEIVGVSLDVNKQTWIKAIKDDGLTWTQLSDLKGQRNEVALMYNVNATPSNFLIDPEGKIIAINLRGESLSLKLKEIFPGK